MKSERQPQVARPERGALADLTDRELLRAYRETKAQDALGQLLLRHTPLVYATCLRVLGDRHTAEDATQATLVVFCRRAGGLAEDGSLRAWLYETARLTATVHRRNEAIRRKHEVQAMRDAQTASGPLTASAAAVSSDLDEALAHLSPKLRRAVVLRHLAGLGEQEAAQELGCTVSAFSVRVTRGLEKLRAYFAKRGHLSSVGALVAVMAEAQAVEVPAGLALRTLAVCTGHVAAPAATLAAIKKMETAMFWLQVKWAATVVLCTALVAGGVTIGLKAGEPARDAAEKTPAPVVPGPVAGPPPAPAASAPGTQPHYGAPDFVPTPERPVGWRGDGTGQYPGATPPIEWSETKNIVWKTKMPQFSHSTPEEMEKVHIHGFVYPAQSGYFVKKARTYSTPVPVGDRVFTTVEPAALVCCDARTGKILWVRDHEPHKWPTTIRWHQDHEPVAAQWPKLYGFGYSTPTPVSDGQRVYVRFGNGVAAAYDMDGTLIWLSDVRYRIDPTKRGYDLCLENLHQSPVLVRNKLIFFLDLGNRVLALDATTGKKAWELDVPVGPWYEKANPFEWAIWAGSPIVARIGDLETVVSSAGIMVTPDGKLLSPNIGIRSGCHSILFSNGVLYAATSRTGSPWGAVRITSSPTGVTSTRLWSIGIRSGDEYASPVLYEGMLIFPGRYQQHELTALDPVTGEVIKRCDVGGSMYASTSVAGGYLFAPTQGKGSLVAVFQGKDLKEVARNKVLEENEGSCLAFQGDRIYFRGRDSLYCIGRDCSTNTGIPTPWWRANRG